MVFGIFDGHGGPACAQVVAKRIFQYIAASLLPSDVLHKLLNPIMDKSSADLHLLDTYNDRYDLVEDLQTLYTKHFKDFLHDLTAQDQTEFNMRSALERAFIRLDDDIIKEAKVTHQNAELLKNYSSGAQENKSKGSPADTLLFKKTMSIAVSGACAAVAHVDGEHLHVASCGDCQVVLGIRTGEAEADGTSTWDAQTLTNEHNSENSAQVERILQEHPPAERDMIIRNDRLLGQLAPLRAFGDVRLVLLILSYHR